MQGNRETDFQRKIKGGASCHTLHRSKIKTISLCRSGKELNYVYFQEIHTHHFSNSLGRPIPQGVGQDPNDPL